jgi:hypothetical protein
VGHVAGNLQVTGEATTANVALSAEGTALGELRADPFVWQPTTEVGAAVEQVVTVSNTGPSPRRIGSVGASVSILVEGRLISVQGLSTPAEGDFCSGAALQVGDSCRFTIRFAPQEPGDYEGGAFVSASDGGPGTGTTVVSLVPAPGLMP